MERLLLTPTEAAQAIGLSRSKLYELMAGGLIESVVIGRCRRVPVAALAEYVDQLRVTAESVRL